MGNRERSRTDIETGVFGGFGKSLNEEIDKEFLSIDRVARAMDAHPSTDRRWLEDADTRFIVHTRKKLYFKEDALGIVEKRKRTMGKVKARKESRVVKPARA